MIECDLPSIVKVRTDQSLAQTAIALPQALGSAFLGNKRRTTDSEEGHDARSDDPAMSFCPKLRAPRASPVIEGAMGAMVTWVRFVKIGRLVRGHHLDLLFDGLTSLCSAPRLLLKLKAAAPVRKPPPFFGCV
jgi:hypothetical protein